MDYGKISQGYILKGSDKYGLGDIQNEGQGVQSEVDVWAFPLSSSKSTQIFDYSGVIRTISLSGVITGVTKASLFDNYIVKLDELQTGNQPTVTFHSAMVANATTWNTTAYNSGNFSVKVKSFNWELTAGNPLICNYSLELVESV